MVKDAMLPELESWPPHLLAVDLCASVSTSSCAQPLIRVRPFATLWTVAHEAHLSTGFSRQVYQSGLLFPAPGGLPNAPEGLASPLSPALAGEISITEPPLLMTIILLSSWAWHDLKATSLSEKALMEELAGGWHILEKNGDLHHFSSVCFWTSLARNSWSVLRW